jgi:biopolymer transport protein ExbD
MAKVKVSRRSTRIDMTAMCDVAFLLLSFFIMTATAKMPEPHPVETPASTVQTKLPDENLATITVGDKKVFFTVLGKEVRKVTLKKMADRYNVTFTKQEYEDFSNMQGFGVPLNKLRGLLQLEPAERNAENVQEGIPYDSINNQLKDWVLSAREAAKAVDYKDLDIAIKGDADEDYTTVKRVIDILQEQKKNRFFLVTGLRDEDF